MTSWETGRRVLRARPIAAASALLVAAAGLSMASGQPAQAVQASGGSGQYRTMISWMQWGEAESVIEGDAATSTETVEIGGQTLRTTCTISDISSPGDLVSYRPGTWRGDGFDNLYNIGGPDGANTLVAGVGNRRSGSTVTFDFSCSATLNGADFPLDGLVLADAESSGGNEHVGAQIAPTATWRIIDRVRGERCTLDTTAFRTAGNRLDMYGPQRNTCEQTNDTSILPAPSATAFMDGASSATDVTVSGGGRSAIALGFVVGFDFGDAPASYGEAGAAEQYRFEGGDIPVTTGSFSSTNRGVPVFGSIEPATVAQPTTRLGESVDPELDPSANQGAGADLDDTTGNEMLGGPDDEESVDVPDLLVVRPGEDVTMSADCNGVGRVAGWIDFDGDGTFGQDERSSAGMCAGGSADLSWTTPTTILPDGGRLATYVRIRMAGVRDPMAPTGLTTVGEVEDYPTVITTPPRLTVVKHVGGRHDPSDQFTVGAEGDGLSDHQVTTSGTDTSASTGAAFVSTGAPYTLTDAMADGSASRLQDYAADIDCVDVAADRAEVPVTGEVPRWTVDDLRNGQNVRCTITNTPRALNVAKQAGEVSGPDADGGYTASYQVTVTNSGSTTETYGELVDAPDYPSALTIDGASWSAAGPGAPETGSADGAGPYTLAAAGTELAAGETHTYDVEVRFHGDTSRVSGCALQNRASLPQGQETGAVDDNDACLPVPREPLEPSMTLDKQVSEVTDVDGDGRGVGDLIHYRFKVTNTGDVDLHDVRVADPKIGAVTCEKTTLAPGESTVCRGDEAYVITEQDVENGWVRNTALAHSTDPNGDDVPPVEDTVQTPVPQPGEPTLPDTGLSRATAAAAVGGLLLVTVGLVLMFARRRRTL